MNNLMFESIKEFIPPIHKEGYVFILIFGLVTLLLFSFSKALGWVGLVLTIWSIFFFRDPIRTVPLIKDAIVSPADGVVTKIAFAKPPVELNMPDVDMKRISIFLNVFNVHVNRIPISSRVKSIYYHPGKFLNASLDKASEDNERNSILLQTSSGIEVAVVQIAGLVARRIVCDIKPGQEVDAGERFGIIRFGSRVDIYLPQDIEPSVAEGQIVIGGETILANLTNEQIALRVKRV